MAAAFAEASSEAERSFGRGDVYLERLIEQALADTDEHFPQTLEQQPALLWTSDAEGMITDVGPLWTMFTGIAKEEALGDGWIKGLHPGDAARAAQVWQEAVLTGEPYDVDGNQRSLEAPTSGHGDAPSRTRIGRASQRDCGEGNLCTRSASLGLKRERGIHDETLQIFRHTVEMRDTLTSDIFRFLAENSLNILCKVDLARVM
jgi:PAS domain S-box-containing protein